MARTRPWSNTTPAGSQAAKLIDDDFRDLKVDISERLSEILVDPFTDEPGPLVIKRAAIEPPGASGGGHYHIPYSGFVFDVSGFPSPVYHHTDHYISAHATVQPLLAPIILPAGSIVSALAVVLDRGGASTILIHLWKRLYPNAADALIVNGLIISGAFQVFSIDTGALEIEEASYTLEIDSTGSSANSFKLYGARLTYAVV